MSSQGEEVGNGCEVEEVETCDTMVNRKSICECGGAGEPLFFQYTKRLLSIISNHAFVNTFLDNNSVSLYILPEAKYWYIVIIFVIIDIQLTYNHVGRH